MSTNTLPLLAPTGAGRILGFAGTVARRFVEVVRAWRNYREIETLAGLDDRMLKDIGLTRGDVRDAAAALPWRDPTAILVSRAGERRRARPRIVGRAVSTACDAPPTVPDIDAWSASQFPARSRYY